MESLEDAITNTAVLGTFHQAAEALKKANANLDVDNVHRILDDISEQNDIANEISEAISNPVGIGDEIDEDDLLAQLEDLCNENELDLDVDPVSLPDVPSAMPRKTKPASQAKIEDPDMVELADWAS